MSLYVQAELLLPEFFSLFQSILEMQGKTFFWIIAKAQKRC